MACEMFLYLYVFDCAYIVYGVYRYMVLSFWHVYIYIYVHA